MIPLEAMCGIAANHDSGVRCACGLCLVLLCSTRTVSSSGGEPPSLEDRMSRVFHHVVLVARTWIYFFSLSWYESAREEHSDVCTRRDGQRQRFDGQADG